MNFSKSILAIAIILSGAFSFAQSVSGNSKSEVPKDTGQVKDDRKAIEGDKDQLKKERKDLKRKKRNH